jgi:repressor LexA
VKIIKHLFDKAHLTGIIAPAKSPLTEHSSMEQLTAKQQQILQAIRTHLNNTGQSPTIREIGLAVNLRSSCSVQKQIEALERFGKISRNAFKYRSIEIVGDVKRSLPSDDNLLIPLLGRISGGYGIEAIQEIDPELISLPTSLLPRIDQNRQLSSCEEQKYFEAPLFGLRVIGKSMIDAGIDDGDLVIARRQSSANNGEIVVALIEDNDATVKKYYVEDGRIRLQPANNAFEPIYSSNVRILGKVALSIKQF